eukprot:386432_1
MSISYKLSCKQFLNGDYTIRRRIKWLLMHGYMRSFAGRDYSRSVENLLYPIISEYMPDLTAILSKRKHNPRVPQQQDAFRNKFDPNLLDDIEWCMRKEVIENNIHYNKHQSDKLNKTHNFNLDQADYKQELNTLLEDPAHIVLYLHHCIQNVKNKRHELSKQATKEMMFIENMNYNYCSRKKTKDKDTKKSKDKDTKKKDNDIHFLLAHLAFEYDLIWDKCTICKRTDIGRYDVLKGEFYCFLCHKNGKKELCEDHGSAAGCKFKTDCKKSHLNPNSIKICPLYDTKGGCMYGNKCKQRHYRFPDSHILKIAFEEAPQNQSLGRRKTIQSVHKSFRENFHAERLFEKFGAILNLKDELSETEMFALLVKYGYGTYLLHTFYTFHVLHECKILDIEKWVDESCQDLNRFPFQTILLDWHVAFNVFCKKEFGMNNEQIEQWMNSWDPDTRHLPHFTRYYKYFGFDGNKKNLNIHGFLHLIINILKHYNTMFNDILGKKKK